MYIYIKCNVFIKHGADVHYFVTYFSDNVCTSKIMYFSALIALCNT